MQVFKFQRVLNYINKVFEFYSVLLLVLVIASISTQVIFRYVLRNPLIWIEEVTRIFFIWMIFMGSIVAHSKLAHPRVEFFTERYFPNFTKIFIKILLNVSILGFLVLMMVYGFNLATRLRTVSMSTTGISQLYVYIAIPIAAVVMMINQINFIILDFIAQKENK